MRCLPPNPCEVLFPAAEEALTSNAFLSQRPSTPPPNPLQPQPILDQEGGGQQGQAGIPSMCLHQWLLSSRANKTKAPECSWGTGTPAGF